MPEADAIDVILRVANLRKFVAEMEAARASVVKMGKAGAEATGESAAAGGASPAARAAGLGLIRKAAIGTTIAVGAIGFEAAKMGIKFDESMTRLVTQAGESESRMKKLESGVLNMSKAVGFGPQSLSEGLYHLESIGLRGDQALKALHTSADLAGVGFANLETTASAVGSAFIVGIKGAGDFTHVAALMNAAVGSGNIRMQELAEALGTGILSNAKFAGLSIQNVVAAIATLTDAGWKASSASAQLATAFHYLYAPSAKAEKALAGIKLTGLELIEMMHSKGLPGALKLLQSHLGLIKGKTPQESESLRSKVIAEIVPGGRGRSLTSLMTLLPRLEEKERFANAATNKRWSESVRKYHETAAFKIRSAWSGVQADLTKLGKMLEPVAVALAQALKGVADSLVWVVNAIKNIVTWVGHASPMVKALLITIGLFAGQAALLLGVTAAWKLLTGAIKGAKLMMVLFGAESKIALLTNPITLILMALVAIAILIITHWKQVRAALMPIWNWMKQAFKDTIDAIVGAAESVFHFFKTKWPLIVALMFGPIGLGVYEIIKHWRDIIHFFEGLGGVFKSIGDALWHAMFGGFKWFVNNLMIKPLNLLIAAENKLATAYNDIPIHIGTAPHVSPIAELAGGGYITSQGSVLVGERGPELLNLPRGASVVPLTAGAGAAEAGIAPKFLSHTVIQIERKTVAEAVGTFTADNMARR